MLSIARLDQIIAEAMRGPFFIPTTSHRLIQTNCRVMDLRIVSASIRGGMSAPRVVYAGERWFSPSSIAGRISFAPLPGGHCQNCRPECDAKEKHKRSKRQPDETEYPTAIHQKRTPVQMPDPISPIILDSQRNKADHGDDRDQRPA